MRNERRKGRFNNENRTEYREYNHDPRAGSLSYYGYDSGGSVRQLSDSAGTISDTYAYDGLGNSIAHAGGTINEIRYRGEQFDAGLRSCNSAGWGIEDTKSQVWRFPGDGSVILFLLIAL